MNETILNQSLVRPTKKGEQVRPCRFCSHPLVHTMVDLGMSPLCESVRRAEDVDSFEVFYPLHVFVCDQCWLAQLREYVTPENIFSEYAYFSSMSSSWLNHAKQYVESMVARFQLSPSKLVVEIASNDGYLLQNFVQRKIPCLGIEPAANVAKVAESNGVRSIVRFFGQETARALVADGLRADLLLGNNVLAHVPDLNDFVAGMKLLLNSQGVITMEFPHLLQLMRNNQFDTIYHEHYSYLSLSTVQEIFEQHGLSLFDVEELPTHGGSLRIYACHADCRMHTLGPRVDAVLQNEVQAGLGALETYREFRVQVETTKREILQFFLEAKKQRKTIAGYGAPGKGVTLLNYCGIRSDFLDYTVDRNAYKQNTFVPGTGIPVFEPERIRHTQPDYLFILPWNLKDEIVEQMSFIRDWGGKFVVPIPRIEILP